MKGFRIDGPARIRGGIALGGNKNAALPVLAATVLTDEPMVIRNVPDILDVRNMLRILAEIGSEYTFEDGTVRIRLPRVRSTVLSREACSRLRASFLVAGPLCVRAGRASVCPPGGDVIGHRRLDTHFYGLRKLGMELDLASDLYSLRLAGRPAGSDIFLDEASVTATEHILASAVLAEGVTVIRNAASEPHVTQLGLALNAMGARISGLETNRLVIEGVDRLSGAEIEIEGDHITAASYLALAGATGGDIVVRGNIRPCHYWMTRRVFERLGLEFTVRPGELELKGGRRPRVRQDFGNVIPSISDGPWPQFPSDTMSCMIALATQAEGTVLFFEKMFESRIYFVDKLIAMGAKAVVCDPHRVVVSGPADLHGIEMTSPDIRAGMAMIIAACCATGVSVIRNADMVCRGYGNLYQNLLSLGVDVQEVDL